MLVLYFVICGGGFSSGGGFCDRFGVGGGGVRDRVGGSFGAC